ncbi:hypothetical protein HispidOSU_031481, partial [Sigmodon hispidus]
ADRDVLDSKGRQTLEFGKTCNVFRAVDGEELFLPRTSSLCQGSGIEIPAPWKEREIKQGGPQWNSEDGPGEN